jgi:signal transduction histidine kinase
MPGRPVFYKRVYLINRKMQLKYAGMIGLVLVIFLGLVQLHTYYVINSILPNILSTEMGNSIKSIQTKLLINGVFYTAIVALVSIFISHKIAGPLYRLEKEIKEVVNSRDFDHKFVLREGDELTSLVDSLNLLLNELKKKVEEK